MARWSKMTYVAVARTVKPFLTGPFPDLEKYVHEMATLFERDNPRFDRARFLRDCGLGAFPNCE